MSALRAGAAQVVLWEPLPHVAAVAKEAGAQLRPLPVGTFLILCKMKNIAPCRPRLCAEIFQNRPAPVGHSAVHSTLLYSQALNAVVHPAIF